MSRVKVRRTHREELPGIVLLRDAMADDGSGASLRRPVLDLDMEVDPTLDHLMTHDPNGFFSAVLHDETLGYAVAHVRSRQWILSEIGVLPQHRGQGIGTALLGKALAYGERAGVKSWLTLVPRNPALEALLLKHDLRPLTPLYVVRVEPGRAARLGRALSALHPGQDVTAELLSRRGQADLDRIDTFSRGVVREGDHVFWLKRAGLNASFVRQGNRIAAYGYGGTAQVGPVAGTTREAALAALGQSMLAALEQGPDASLVLRVPATFEEAMVALLENGARLEDTWMIHTRGESHSFDRYIPGIPVLP